MALGGKEHLCQCRRYKKCVLDAWDRKIPYRRAWQPTPVFFFFLFFFFYYLFNFFTLQYCIGFAIHQHESSTGVHMSPFWTPFLPPSPFHPSGCPSALALSAVSCIELGLMIYFTYGNIHVSMLFSQISSPSPSPTESISLSLYLCLFFCLTYRVIIIIFLNSIYMH